MMVNLGIDLTPDPPKRKPVQESIPPTPKNTPVTCGAALWWLDMAQVALTLALVGGLLGAVGLGIGVSPESGITLAVISVVQYVLLMSVLESLRFIVRKMDERN